MHVCARLRAQTHTLHNVLLKLISFNFFRTYQTQCSATLYVVATRDSQELVIRDVKLEHSHNVSQAIKASYPESRRLPPAVEAEAASMLSVCVHVEHLRRKDTCLRNQIILCAFHVAKTFRKETTAMETASEDRERVRKELQAMLYATKFHKYLTKNSDTVKTQWVRCFVDANGHLGNHTTNRIEAYHSALKRFQPAKQSVREMVHGLQLYNKGVHVIRDHNALRSHMTQAVSNQELEDAHKQYKAIVTDAAAHDIQKTISTAHKLKKGATVEHTDD